MKRLLKGIFISLFAVFLMSHNTYAAVNVIPNTSIGTFNVGFNSSSLSTGFCNDATGTQWYTSAYLGVNPSVLNNSRYYLFALPFQNSQNNNSFDGYIPLSLKTQTGLNVVYSEVISGSPSQQTLYFIVFVENAQTAANYWPQVVLSGSESIRLNPYECIQMGFYTRVDFPEVSSPNYNASLNTISQQLSSINQYLQRILDKPTDAAVIEEQGEAIQGAINDLNSSVDERNQKEYDAVDNIDNQSTSDIPNSSDQQTTNLLGIFTSFVSAITAAGATNCNITANWGHLNLGVLNLCRDTPPAFVQVIGSIILIVILVPCAYWLVMRILSEIRSFTNG